MLASSWPMTITSPMLWHQGEPEGTIICNQTEYYIGFTSRFWYLEYDWIIISVSVLWYILHISVHLTTIWENSVPLQAISAAYLIRVGNIMDEWGCILYNIFYSSCTVIILIEIFYCTESFTSFECLSLCYSQQCTVWLYKCLCKLYVGHLCFVGWHYIQIDDWLPNPPKLHIVATCCLTHETTEKLKILFWKSSNAFIFIVQRRVECICM